MKNYWEKFYQNNHDLKIINRGSSFSRYVLKQIKNYQFIIDLGCGNGRDSIFFNSYGKKVIGVDQCNEVIKLNKKKFKKKNLKFIHLDVCNNLSEKIKIKKPKCFYSRFLIHSLKPSLIKSHISQISKIFNNNDVLFMEYRCFEDKTKTKTFNDHYRNFMKTNDIENILIKNKLKSSYVEKGLGFAKFKKENPFVARHTVIRIS